MAQRGRPKVASPKTTRFSIRLDASMESLLEGYCERNDITKGEAIRQGIELLLAKERRQKNAKKTS